jgi:hypothetical protein
MWPSYLVNNDGSMALRLIGWGIGAGEVGCAWCERAGQARASATHIMSRGLRGTATGATQRMGVAAVVHSAGPGMIG